MSISVSTISRSSITSPSITVVGISGPSFIPLGAVQYWNRTLSNLTEAITEQVNKVNLTTTVCADDRNIIQQDGAVVTYAPNVAAFNVGVGMVVPRGATNILIGSGLVDEVVPDGAPVGWELLQGSSSASVAGISIGTGINQWVFTTDGINPDPYISLNHSASAAEAHLFSMDVEIDNAQDLAPRDLFRVASLAGGEVVFLPCEANPSGGYTTGLIQSGEYLVSITPAAGDLDFSIRIGIGCWTGVPNLSGISVKISTPQVELGGIRTPFILTTTAPATRAATVATSSGFIEPGLLIDTNSNGGVDFQMGEANTGGYVNGIDVAASKFSLDATSGGQVSKYRDTPTTSLWSKSIDWAVISDPITGSSIKISNSTSSSEVPYILLTGDAADLAYPTILTIDISSSKYFSGNATLATMVSDVRAVRVAAGDNGAALDALGTPALWPVDNIRAGMGEAGKDIILDALTNGGVFFENGNLKASIVGANLQVEIGASVATIAVSTVADVLQSFAVLEAGQLYAEANFVRGTGVANPGFEPSNTFTQGSDNAGVNHFEGTPTFPTMLIQDIS